MMVMEPFVGPGAQNLSEEVGKPVSLTTEHGGTRKRAVSGQMSTMSQGVMAITNQQCGARVFGISLR